MPTEAFASPLIVWFGPHRYTFPVGRDVTIGRDSRADIRLDGVGTSASPTHAVLHHNGRQWIAVDRSEGGIYVDGVRMSTVFIHDGRAITLGDPQHGPRLVFQLGAPPPPPPRFGPPPRIQHVPPPPPPVAHRPPDRPGWWSPAQPPPRFEQPTRPAVPRPPVMPTQPAPQPVGPAPAPPPPVHPVHQPIPPQPPATAAPHPTPPPWSPSLPPSPAQTAPASDWPAAQRKRPAFVERLTGAMQKLRPQRSERRPHEAPLPVPVTPAPEPRPHEATPTTALRRPDTPDTPETSVVEAPPAVPVTPAPEPRPHEATPTTALRRPDAPDTPETSVVEAPLLRRTGKAAALEARQLRLTVDGQQALADLSFTAEPGKLTAVVGLSEASTSALVEVLGGAVQPSVGTVRFDGDDVAADHLRPFIGMVPRYDLLHPALTVEQALGYAAELRLPPGTSADHRRQVVHSVLDEMKLSPLRTIQLGDLTAEQRKRASVAMELLTSPSLLVLDQPTTGFDPAAKQEMTATLRRFADDGRVVVVATTSPADLDMYDQVVLLTATGSPAFAGAPAQIGDELGTTDWAEIFARVNADPYAAHDAYLARQHEPPPVEATPQPPAEEPAPAGRLSRWRQIAVVTRRQAWVTVGDQRYFIFLTILPVLFGAIALLVPGHAGLGPANPYGTSPDEAVEILAVLNIGAVVMGTALGIRDLFGEQRIFRREQANGLSASAFLAGKIIVYSLVAVIQTGIITAAAVVGKGAPTHGAALLGGSTFGAALELFVTLAATAIVSAMVALALSELAKYSEQMLLAAVLIVLISVVFAGAMFPLAGKFGLEQISWLVPSRWGFAASASTVDVHAVNLLASTDDSWKHSTRQWLFDMGMLLAFGVVAAGWLRWRLRRPARQHAQRS